MCCFIIRKIFKHGHLGMHPQHCLDTEEDAGLNRAQSSYTAGTPGASPDLLSMFSPVSFRPRTQGKEHSWDLIHWTTSKTTQLKGRRQQGVWKRRGGWSMTFLPPHCPGQARPWEPGSTPQGHGGITLQVHPAPIRSTHPESSALPPHTATSIILISRWSPWRVPGYQDGVHSHSPQPTFTVHSSELPHTPSPQSLT